MTPGMLVAASAPAFSIELPTIVAVMAVIVTILLALLSGMAGILLWAGKGDLTHNERAHQALHESIEKVERRAAVIEADVKDLLTGQARIEGLLGARNQARVGVPDKYPPMNTEMGVS